MNSLQNYEKLESEVSEIKIQLAKLISISEHKGSSYKHSISHSMAPSSTNSQPSLGSQEIINVEPLEPSHEDEEISINIISQGELPPDENVNFSHNESLASLEQFNFQDLN